MSSTPLKLDRDQGRVALREPRAYEPVQEGASYECINEAAGARLPEYLARELKGEELTRFEAHLRACHACEEIVEQARKLFASAREKEPA